TRHPHHRFDSGNAPFELFGPRARATPANSPADQHGAEEEAASADHEEATVLAKHLARPSTGSVSGGDGRAHLAPYRSNRSPTGTISCAPRARRGSFRQATRLPG